LVVVYRVGDTCRIGTCPTPRSMTVAIAPTRTHGDVPQSGRVSRHPGGLSNRLVSAMIGESPAALLPSEPAVSHTGLRCASALLIASAIVALAQYPGPVAAQDKDKDKREIVEDRREDSEAIRKLEPLIPAIKAALQGTNPEAQRAAFVAVGELPLALVRRSDLSDTVGAALQKGVKDPDLLAIGLRSYGKSDPRAADIAKVLSPHQTAENPAVREAAAEAVASVLANAVPAAKLIDKAKGFIDAATQSLPLVAKALDDADTRTQWWALEGLHTTIRTVTEVVKNESTPGPGADPKGKLDPLNPVFDAIGNAFSKLSGPLAADDFAVRTAAVRVLDDVGNLRRALLIAQPAGAAPLVAGLKAAYPALADRVADPDPEVRLAAVETIESLDRGVDGSAALIRATSDTSVFVRWAAARALGRLAEGTPEVSEPGPRIRALARMTGDRDIDVRTAALTAVAKYGTSAKSAIPNVVAAADRGDVEPRLVAIRALASLQSDAETTVPVLIDGLRHRDLRLRRAAAAALVRFGAKARPALEELRIAMASTDSELRLAAAAAVLAIEVRVKPRDD
jgi:HEAT repeat protein